MAVAWVQRRVVAALLVLVAVQVFAGGGGGGRGGVSAFRLWPKKRTRKDTEGAGNDDTQQLLMGGADYMDGQIIPSSAVAAVNAYASSSVSARECFSGKLPSGMYYFGAAVYNSELIIGGGFTPTEKLSFSDDDSPMLSMNAVNHTFKWTGSSWKVWNQFNVTKGEAHLAVLNGELYSLGSCGRQTRMCLEKYNSSKANEGWHLTKNQLPSVLSFPGVIADEKDSSLFVVGGVQNKHTTRVVAQYSASTDKWFALPPMNIARKSPAVAILGNRLCAVGGVQSTLQYSSRTLYMALRSAECMFLSAPSAGWSLLPLLPEARGSATAFVASNKLYVAGGVHVPLHWLSNRKEDDDLQATVLEVERRPYVSKLDSLDTASSWTNASDSSRLFISSSTLVTVPTKLYSQLCT